MDLPCLLNKSNKTCTFMFSIIMRMYKDIHLSVKKHCVILI